MKKILSIALLFTMMSMSLLISCGKDTVNKNNTTSVRIFNSGIYEGKIGNEVKSIYVFYEDGKGGSVLNLDGMGLPFAYEVKETDKNTGETEVLFHMGDDTDNTDVRVKPINENEYELGVYNLKLVEKDTEKIDEVLERYVK